MTNDNQLLDIVRNALIEALPQDTPSDVLLSAAKCVVATLHAPWFPASEKRIGGADNVNLRSAPSGTGGIIIGTIKKNTGVRAGTPENGWTPVLVHGWVSGEMLR